MNKIFRILGIGALAIAAYTCLTGCETKEEIEAQRQATLAKHQKLTENDARLKQMPEIEYCQGVVIKEHGTITNLQQSLDLGSAQGKNPRPIDVNGNQTSLFYNKIQIEDNTPTLPKKYGLTVKADDGKQYIFYITPGKIKPLELLAEGIEEGDTVKFASTLHHIKYTDEYESNRDRYITADIAKDSIHCHLKDTIISLFTPDGIGEVSSDLVTIIKKAEKKE